ncbi:Peroxiredoxin-5, mitochondrial [Trichoplax sp. H2]|uniref:Peroxiredoxin-5 n=1 Tax=Trichoplax adhaerens TaxID=10228 RepID=B3RM02_TRIAD|nr:hypothetical protein TRIADDRAFT_18263 [Trichoplax adhaerens]EDV28876.1 hypothetical protein TRIADDRAFT_18263 [Trichoplax adhaerens]RDD46628.1 Peroxiredoxin-5, mitochondrial [Trichoplax sp. H2]|eukprot:XP_002108078.1 hypothetical protein TRIADDRAFT_18263 [Trichoplax adhaerens]
MTSVSLVTTFARRFSSTSRLLQIQVGDKLPSIALHQNSPGNKVDIRQLFANKKGILFAVPGAFTPGCSKTHLPGYLQHYDNFKSKGIDVIACVSVNDAFVVDAWSKSNNVDDRLEMLADTSAQFTKSVGLDFDATPVLGNIRSKRYAMIIEDTVVKQINVEPDGTGLSCSLAQNILEQLS